jgi:hypothetical protein
MGIEDPKLTHPDLDLIESFDLLTQTAPLIAGHQGNGTMSAVLMRSPSDPPQQIKLGDYTFMVSFYQMPKMFGVPPPKEPLPPAAAIFIAVGPDEFYAIGGGVSVTFTPSTPGPPLAALGDIEEGAFVNGKWVAGRRLNGDDSDEGNFLMLQRPTGCCWPGTLTKGIQHFTLYRYR